MPQKIRLRDLDPSLVALIAGGEIGEGQLNNILSRYRKKSEVIVEQDIDAAYRNALYGRIDDVKTKLEDHLAQALVVADSNLTPELRQRIVSLEEKVNNFKEGKDFTTDIQLLQNDIKELHDSIDALNVGNLSTELVSLRTAVEKAQDDVKQMVELNDGFKTSLNEIRSAMANKRDKDALITENDLNAVVLNKLSQSEQALEQMQNLSNSVNTALASKRDKTELIGEADLDAATVEKIKQSAESLTKVQELSNKVTTELEGKRDKSELIKETDLDVATVAKLDKGVDALNKVQALNDTVSSGLASKRDKSDAITEDDLDAAAAGKLNRGGEALKRIDEVSDSVNAALADKRDKSVLIGENDLTQDIVNKLKLAAGGSDAIDALSAEVTRQLANKRDKDVLINGTDLSQDINKQLAHIYDIDGSISNLSSNITNGLDAKRDKSVPIKITDLDTGVSDAINKVMPLVNRLDSFENDVKNSLDSKRGKNDLIVENDLASELANKIGRGASAYDSVLDLQSRMNMFPQVNPGDLLTVSYSGGSVSGKKLFMSMLTVADEADAVALKENKDVSVVFVRSICQVFAREKKEVEPINPSSAPAASGTPSAAGTETQELPNLVAQEDFFTSDVSYWNTFIVDEDTKAIVAYVMSGGEALRFGAKERRKALKLAGGATMNFACGNAISIPVRVLAKDTSGKYTPADGVITVLYDVDSYTLHNESDETLDIIVIEG